MKTYLCFNVFNAVNCLMALTSKESVLELVNLNFYVSCGILLKLKKGLTER